MKKLALLIILLIQTFQLLAIDFFQGTYQEALEKGKQENKLILF